MTIPLSFNPEELDVLRELMNVGMGRAGVNLSEVFEERVTLSVPDVALMSLLDLKRKFDSIEYPTRLNLVRQSFAGGIAGESFVVFSADAFRHIVDFMGYEQKDADNKGLQREMLLDLTNSVNAACLSGIAAQLDLSVELSEPLFTGFMLLVNDSDSLIKSQNWMTGIEGQVMVLNVEFVIREKGFYCETIYLINSDCLAELHQRIGNILSE